MHRLTAATLLSLTLVLPAPLAAEEATGLWRTESTAEGHLEVRIAPCGTGALCGTIERARDTSGQAQPYPHTGRQMISGMEPAGPGAWRGGRIWDPRNDRTFNSRMSVSGDRLNVAGCILGICQQQTWTRVR